MITLARKITLKDSASFMDRPLSGKTMLPEQFFLLSVGFPEASIHVAIKEYQV